MLEHDLRTETAALLADLIRIDTTNPPGNETPAAEHLAAYLAEAGVRRRAAWPHAGAGEPGGPPARHAATGRR